MSPRRNPTLNCELPPRPCAVTGLGACVGHKARELRKRACIPTRERSLCEPRRVVGPPEHDEIQENDARRRRAIRGGTETPSIERAQTI